MAEIRVKAPGGFFGKDLATALQMYQMGDTIVLPEGHHVVDNPIDIPHLHFVGRGAPDRIILEGAFQIVGQASFTNLTLKATHFNNAVNAQQPGSSVHLREVVVHAEPGEKYPAIFLKNATAHIESSRVVQSPGIRSIVLESADLQTVGASLGTIIAQQSVLNLTSSAVEILDLTDRSKLTVRKGLNTAPPPGKRALVLHNESVGIIDILIDQSDSAEAYCDDSFLDIGSVLTPNAEVFGVYVGQPSTVHVPEEKAAIHYEQQLPEEPQQEPEPQDPHILYWHPDDGDAFEAVIAPQLVPGMTLVLDEGEYCLGVDAASVLILNNVRIIGRGRREHIIVSGGFSVMPGAAAEVENITIQAVEDGRAFDLHEDAEVTFTNVRFDTERATEQVLLSIGAGQVRLTDCEVVASAADNWHGLASIGGSAQVTVEHTRLGWLAMYNEASVALYDSSLLSCEATDNAIVKSHGQLEIMPSAEGLLSLSSLDQATLDVESLVVSSPTSHLALNQAVLRLGEVQNPDQHELQVTYDPTATLDVPQHAVSLIQRELEVTPAEREVSATPQPQTPDAGENYDVPQPDAPETSDAVQMPVNNEVADPLGQIMDLTGLEKVKDQINSFVHMVRFNQARAQRGLQTTDMTLHSLFLGNPGTGKTTVARLLGQALYQTGVISSDTFVEVSRKDLVGTTLGSSATMTREVLEEALGGVLFIDEAYSLYQENNNEFAEEAVNELLAFMENHRHDIMVIFAGYTDQMHDFMQMNPGLKSRIPHQFNFEDYSAEQIASMGYQQILTEQYLVDEITYRSAVIDGYQRSLDRSNGRWVRNFNQDLIRTMAQRVAGELATLPQTDVDLQTITPQDLQSFIGGDVEEKQANIQRILAELDSLIGLDGVKAWVKDLLQDVQADQQLKKINQTISKPTYHMVFEGNPGTGKTTVARIVAQLFYNLDILASPNVTTVDRSDLVGRYIGHTEANTTRVIDQALGGVLFVDEAYQLSATSEHDFGTQAIETFMTRLEDDRDKFIAIFAGYTPEMQEFLATNPGLSSRIPLRIEFDDYSPEQIGQIVVARLARTWTFNTDLLADIVARIYAAVPSEDRSNGRWARTISDDIASAHKRHIAPKNLAPQDLAIMTDELLYDFARRRGLNMTQCQQPTSNPTE